MDYYLYVHENPNAPRRTNGLQFWGYPNRTGNIDPTVIVIHTAENLPDPLPPDGGAEAVASYFTRNSRPASAHSVVDSDSLIRLLPDESTAFHVRGYNTQSWGLEIATQARKWDTIPPDYADLLLRAAAEESARVATKFSIPVVFRTKQQIDAGLPGFTGHTNLDPTRRTDPGFTPAQWIRFLDLVRQYQNGDTPMHRHTPPAGSTHSWFDQVWATVVDRYGIDDDTRDWNLGREDLGWIVERIIDPLLADIADLGTQLAALAGNVGVVTAELATALDRISALEARVTELEAQEPLSLPLDVRISTIP